MMAGIFKMTAMLVDIAAGQLQTVIGKYLSSRWDTGAASHRSQ
jgi:hypothetical protein